MANATNEVATTTITYDLLKNGKIWLSVNSCVHTISIRSHKPGRWEKHCANWWLVRINRNHFVKRPNAVDRPLLMPPPCRSLLPKLRPVQARTIKGAMDIRGPKISPEKRNSECLKIMDTMRWPIRRYKLFFPVSLSIPAYEAQRSLRSTAKLTATLGLHSPNQMDTWLPRQLCCENPRVRHSDGQSDKKYCSFNNLYTKNMGLQNLMNEVWLIEFFHGRI